MEYITNIYYILLKRLEHKMNVPQYLRMTEIYNGMK